MRLRFIGKESEFILPLGRRFEPDEVFDLEDEDYAEALILTGRFIKEAPDGKPMAGS